MCIFLSGFFSGEKLRLHERERGCAYETVNEGRKLGGKDTGRGRETFPDSML